jgi:ABC-2 type transport system ATP-binding protein
MHVMDYLAYLGELQGLSRAALPQRLRRVVEQCGLGQEKHKKIGALSKGYRQRVGLAQALIHDPSVLILDEPTTGLDPNQIVEIRHLIRELGGEKTVILSSHILSEVEATCERILIISKGKIVADGKSGELGSMLQGAYELQVQIEAPTGAEVAAALGALPQVRAVLPEGSRYRLSASADLEVRQAIFRLCVERGWILSELSSVEQKLEDLFRKLTLN